MTSVTARFVESGATLIIDGESINDRDDGRQRLIELKSAAEDLSVDEKTVTVARLAYLVDLSMFVDGAGEPKESASSIQILAGTRDDAAWLLNRFAADFGLAPPTEAGIEAAELVSPEPPPSPPNAVRFAPPKDDLPNLARAASIALAVARHCKAATWAEFVERLAAEDQGTLDLLADVQVDRADSDLITRYDHVLRFLSVKPLVTVAVCPECEAWVMVSAGTAPSRCTVGCGNGKPVKASIATKQKSKDSRKDAA